MSKTSKPKVTTSGSNDFDTFARCSAPKNSEELNRSLDSFFAEVAESREKHRLMNVSIIVLHPVKEDKQESHTICTKHHGDSNMLHAMLAHAYGVEKKLLADRIKLMEDAIRVQA